MSYINENDSGLSVAHYLNISQGTVASMVTWEEAI